MHVSFTHFTHLGIEGVAVPTLIVAVLCAVPPLFRRPDASLHIWGDNDREEGYTTAEEGV